MAKTKTKARMIERARSEEEESDDEDTSCSEEVESDDEEVAITVVGKFGGKELKSSLRKRTRNNKDPSSSEDEVDRDEVAVGLKSSEVAVGLKSRGKVLKRSLQDETSADNSEDEMESNDVAVGLKLKPNQQHLTSRYLQKRARKEGESSEVAVEPRSRGKVFNLPQPPSNPLMTTPRQSSSSTSSTPSSSDDDDDDDTDDDDDEDEDDDDDDEDEDDEEEKMGSQSDIHISVQLIPLFQLHCQLEDKLHYQPNTKACKFNCRGLDISRLTCMDPLDNMPSKLRAEEQNANISVVDGVVVVVVTSFSEATEPGVISLPMTSVAFPEGDATHYATPLELDTINEANRWLRGIAFEKSEEHGKQATTVEEGLKEYITLLENQVPKQISAQDLRNFITDHHWPADCWGFNQCE